MKRIKKPRKKVEKTKTRAVNPEERLLAEEVDAMITDDMEDGCLATEGMMDLEAAREVYRKIKEGIY